ncbi:succinyl-diaminopimelate desuccinylase [Acuticoccus sp. MNP-M23]|uniref:succinyl-diaminopimelate desuccinylase n=1 Tax=Acuticoccus sp. MNP-M23 TaxID=3072793 RepID=UPI002815DD8A|nr:succinyl-diaminopimelate desuccinylase [Acuticoccus sp. MNP-M23]WMS43611.1 succinyl-diaminopimelate desuccinylase [Acuticoccus sp. MNP-M23]
MSRTPSATVDPVALAKDLIRVNSVTPAGPACFDIVETVLAGAGFTVERVFFDEDGSGPVENLFATAGDGNRHLAFAGHVDVVPPGPAEAWTHDPFGAATDGDTLYGRGAQDMKGGVAAMIAAAVSWRAEGGPGRISFLITGDEEGPALSGTRPLMAWCAERTSFDAAIVGEPTSREVLGDTIKIGRRGSLSATITIKGKQGHVAYQHNAENPIAHAVAIGAALMAPLDEGSAAFAPTNLEITSMDVGNTAFNVIPGEAALRFNVRFNDHWTADTLKAELGGRIERAAPGAKMSIAWQPGISDCFLTRDDALIEAVTSAVATVTGVTPEATTGGGTSDARFIKNYCPVIEFGAVGSTMHQVDERTSVAELETLTKAYGAIIASVLAP